MPQPTEGITYAHKIEKVESWLDWQQPAEVLARKLRAFDPFPGGAAVLDGVGLKVWAGVIPADHEIKEILAFPFEPRVPGQILQVKEKGIDVACGDGVLRLTELQRPGGKRLSCAEFLRGHPVQPGAVFQAHPT